MSLPSTIYLQTHGNFRKTEEINASMRLGSCTVAMTLKLGARGPVGPEMCLQASSKIK